jgi:hypothetical protein
MQHIKLNDRFLPFGLAIICLAGGWGPNIYATQAMIMVIVAFCALFLCLRDWTVGAMGVFMAVWYTVLYSTGLAEPAIIAESITLIGFGMVIYTITRLGKTSIDSYLDMIIAVAVVLSILGIFGHFTGMLVVATLGNQNFLGAFLAISAFACFRKRRWYFLVLILPALWICHSSTPIAAFFAGLGFYLLRWKGLAMAVIPGAAYFFLLDGGTHIVNGSARFDYWLNAWEYLTASWWTVVVGFGPGIPWNPGKGMLHSEWVNLAWNLGIVGLGLAGLYFWRALKYGNRILMAMIIAVLVDGLGNHLMHTVPTAILSIMVMGLNDRKIKSKGD